MYGSAIPLIQSQVMEGSQEPRAWAEVIAGSNP